MKLLAGVCIANANVLAVFLRVTLIGALMQQKESDRWREGNGLRDKVFEVAATWPLPRGVENADLPAFVAALTFASLAPLCWLRDRYNHRAKARHSRAARYA